MKKPLITALIAATLSAGANAGWLDSLFGSSTEQAETSQTQSAAPATATTQALDAMAMIPMLTDSLGVTTPQAEGGLGSIFNYAKGNLSTDQFGQLASALPGVDSLLAAAPDVSNVTESSGGLGGLLNTAAQYSDSLKAVNTVSQQFEALGLDTEMVMQFVQVAQQYLNTEQGQQAKQLLMNGLGGLTNP